MLQLTFTVCTLGLGVASEVVQGLLPVSAHVHVGRLQYVLFRMELATRRGTGIASKKLISDRYIATSITTIL